MKNGLLVLLITVLGASGSFPGQIAWPDMTVTDVEVSDVDGAIIQFRYTVKNQGSGLAKGGRHDYVYLSLDAQIDPSDYLLEDIVFPDDTLGLGESRTMERSVSVALIAGIPDGDYYLGIHTNAENDIFELITTNNTGYDASPKVSLHRPDLVITQFSFDGIHDNGTWARISYTIENQGTQTIEQGQILFGAYLSSDMVINKSSDILYKEASAYVPALDPGESHTSPNHVFYAESVMPEGTYYFGLCFDLNNEIVESNESNNSAVDPDPQMVIPEALPDFTSRLEVNQTSDELRVEMGLENIGWAGTSDPFYYRAVLSEDPLMDDGDRILIDGSWPSFPFGSGDEEHGIISLDELTPGNFSIISQADFGNHEAELLESNNIDTIEVSIFKIHIDYPDGGETWVKGEPYTIRWSAEGPVPGAFVTLHLISLSRPDRLIGEVDNNGSYQFTPPGDLEDGSDYKVRLNMYYSSSEYRYAVFSSVSSDDFFTIQSAPVSLPKPDLILPALTLADSTGPDIEFSMQMKNQGDAAASGPFHVQAYLSPDQGMSPGNDHLIKEWTFSGTVNAGSDQWTPQLDAALSGIPGGKYYLWGRIDARDLVNEHNEGNNFTLLTGPRVTVPGEGGGSVPEVPEILYPAANTLDIPLQPTLRWQPGGGTPVTRYELIFVDQWGAFVFADNAMGDTAVQVGPLQPGRDYSWKIRAGNTEGWSDFTDLLLFTTTGKKCFVAKNIGPNAGIAPRIDGILDEPFWFMDYVYTDWESLVWGGQPESWNSRWSEFQDGVVSWKAVWCEGDNTLYVAARVKDDIAGDTDHEAASVWQDDSIELYTDGDRSGGSHTDGYGNAQQWQIRRDNLVHLLHESTAYAGSDIVTAVQEGDNGDWTLEAALRIYDDYPGQRKELQTGDVMGWEVWYNDSDNDSRSGGLFTRDHQIGWRYTGPAYLQADHFQELEFGDYLSGYEGFIRNSFFHFDLEHWYLFVHTDASATASVQSGEFVADISSGGGNAWSVQLQQGSLLLENGSTYTVSFDAYAVSDRTIHVSMGMNASPYTVYGNLNSIQLTQTKTRYSFTFTMNHDTDPAGRIAFDLGTSDVNVMIDNVSVEVESGPTDVETEGAPLSGGFCLAPNYPNPFNGGTRITYVLPRSCSVEITVFDVMGQSILKLDQGLKSAGRHVVNWDSRDSAGNAVSSGLYLLRVSAGGNRKTQRMLLIR